MPAKMAASCLCLGLLAGAPAFGQETSPPSLPPVTTAEPKAPEAAAGVTSARGEAKPAPGQRPPTTIRFVKQPSPVPSPPPTRKPASWLPNFGSPAAPSGGQSALAPVSSGVKGPLSTIPPAGPILLVSGRTRDSVAPAVRELPGPGPDVDMNGPFAAALQELGIKPAGARQPQPQGQDVDSSEQYQIQLEPPGPQRIFRLESEAAMFERLRQEQRNRTPPERIQFPEEPVLSNESYKPREFAAITRLVEPNYVCHGRLYFERVNSERYAWEVPILQPFLSTAAFYWDTALLPYHWASEPLRCYDCSAGKCLPGDPVPYLLYPPHLNLKGAVIQAGVVLALVAIFP